MINWFLKTFPLPDHLKDQSNWNTQIVESTSFSPLDNDSGDMAEGNKPIELVLFGIGSKVNSWQDVFIKFLECIRDLPEYDFEYVLVNQLELFKNEKTIVKWSALKELIEVHPDLSTRYKTFDGKTWDKSKELNDDLLFIHINISASTCMARISYVMEKMFMPFNSIEIKLK